MWLAFDKLHVCALTVLYLAQTARERSTDFGTGWEVSALFSFWKKKEGTKPTAITAGSVQSWAYTTQYRFAAWFVFISYLNVYFLNRPPHSHQVPLRFVSSPFISRQTILRALLLCCSTLIRAASFASVSAEPTDSGSSNSGYVTHLTSFPFLFAFYECVSECTWRVSQSWLLSDYAPARVSLSVNLELEFIMGNTARVCESLVLAPCTFVCRFCWLVSWAFQSDEQFNDNSDNSNFFLFVCLVLLSCPAAYAVVNRGNDFPILLLFGSRISRSPCKSWKSSYSLPFHMIQLRII